MKLFLKIIKWMLILFFGISALSVLAYRFVPVSYTPLMVIRCVQQVSRGETPRLHHEWVDLDSISPHLRNAIIASEDQNFEKHHGFDFEAIEVARKEYEAGGRRRGASTISQQTAKNVFLWPTSSWVRKGFETYFTVMIELMWPKERIIEVYLNSIEMGDGIYGAQAVAHEHFGTSADKLSRHQCALIAATLPNPIKFNSATPSSYIRRRSRQIEKQMRFMGN